MAKINYAAYTVKEVQKDIFYCKLFSYLVIYL